MSFSCPHYDIKNDGCYRLKTDCVPGRPGCVLKGSSFAIPVMDRLREREEEKRFDTTQPRAKKPARPSANNRLGKTSRRP